MEKNKVTGFTIDLNSFPNNPEYFNDPKGGLCKHFEKRRICWKPTFSFSPRGFLLNQGQKVLFEVHVNSRLQLLSISTYLNLSFGKELEFHSPHLAVEGIRVTH